MKLNQQQQKDLEKYKKEQWALVDKIHGDLMPLISEDLKQLRNLTKDVAIISGAIAAFTIPTLNTDLIKGKELGYAALFLLFLTIFYAVYHLSSIVKDELNGLSRQHKVYLASVFATISRINKVVENGNINHLIEYDSKEELSKINSIKVNEEEDRSLDRINFLLGVSLFLIFFSFFRLK